MDEDVKSSFHDSLSRFAYHVGPSVPSVSTSTLLRVDSSLSSHHHPSRSHTDADTATVHPRNRIHFSNVLDLDDAGDGKADIAASESSSLARKRKVRETTEKEEPRKGKIDREYSDV